MPMYLNVYCKQSYLQEPKPVLFKSYPAIKNTIYDVPESDVFEVRAYGTHKVIKKCSKDKYFYRKEDFDAQAEPERIKDF